MWNNDKKFLSLKYKLLYFSILISGLITIFISLIEIRNDIADYKTLVHKEFSRFKETHLPYLTNKIWAMEYADLKKYAENEIQEQWFDSISIYDIQGVVIASAGHKASNSHEAKFYFTYNHNNKDIVIGSIFLTANIPLFGDVLKERWLSVFIMNGLLVFSIFICSYLFLNKLILSRIQKIISETQDEKRFDRLEGKPVQSKSKFRDEIDLLINALNERGKQLFRELTRRKKTEESLKFQALILDSIQDHVTATDIKGNILYVNEAELSAAKREKNGLMNQSVEIYGEDVTKGATQKEIIENTLKFDNWRGEVVNYASDGSEIIMDCRTQLIRDEEGNPWRMVGISTDITRQKQSETERDLLLTAIEQAAETIVITDANGDIQYANKAFEKLTGYHRNDVIGKNPNILKSGSHDTSFYKTMWDTILSGEVWIGEIKNQNKYGDIFIEKATISPVKDSTGNITNFVAVKHDITEQIKIQNQLQQSQKMESIGTLAGGIAHDFNNILFPIIGHTELLLDDVSEDSPFKESLSQIYAAAMRASELVKQILTFSRQKSGELKLMKMQPIIKEVLKLIRSTIPTTIEIKQDINPDCGVIKADPTQIHQIIMNLSTNAYHAMEETGGVLKVSLKEMDLGKFDLMNPEMTPGAYACLTISDTGVGMDKKVTDKIFDPFFTTKEKGKGTGMGLSVVHGIVTSMNGAIQVYSEPGKGTVFNVYLPVEKNSSAKQISNSKIKIQRGAGQILLVDDEEAILSMEKQMLERIGYQVTSCISSLEALEAFRNNPDKFDLVITDMAMPNMPGDKFAVELTHIRPDILILLCTGFSETISEEKAASIGIKGFLWKPIVMKDLAQKIRELLDKNQT